jgi:enoyl-[acyl-carrier protein] reductase II
MLINEMLGIKYPIIQGAMTLITDGKFASTVSNAGGLGIIASGEWDKNKVREEIHIARSLTDKPFGVNLYMMSPYVEDIVDLIIEEKIPVVTTGAHSPEKYIKRFKEAGCKVFPVVASVTMAKRIERFGIDGVIAEGMESGGHVGEATTMSLLPQMVKALKVPVIAAGGIASGSQMTAALAMGASGIQIGTVLLASEECDVHENYKKAILKAHDNDTTVILKNTGAPVRVLKNRLARKYLEMERNNSIDEEALKDSFDALFRGIFQGDLENGSMPLGQIAGLIDEIKPVKEILDDIIRESVIAYDSLSDNINKLKEMK